LYAGFGIGRDAIAESWTIAPPADRLQDYLIFTNAATIEDERAMDAAICAHNEADANPLIFCIELYQRIRSDESLRRADVSTARQGKRFRDGREFGQVRREAAQLVL
jgi:hypothetical protein